MSHLNLVAQGQEHVEAHDEVWVTLEEHRDSANETRCVDRLALELLKFIDYKVTGCQNSH